MLVWDISVTAMKLVHEQHYLDRVILFKKTFCLVVFLMFCEQNLAKEMELFRPPIDPVTVIFHDGV